MEIDVQKEYFLYDNVGSALIDYRIVKGVQDDNYNKATKSSNLTYFDNFKNVLSVGIYTTVGFVNQNGSSKNNILMGSPGIIALLDQSFAYSSKNGFSYDRGEVCE